MASQDARLSKFEADFKQQQSEMINKIDTVLKAITDRMMGALPSDTVKNPKLNISPTTSVLSACSYQREDPQCSSLIHGSVNTITLLPKQLPDDDEQEDRSNPENATPPPPPDPSISFITEKVRNLNSFLESSGIIPQSSNTEFVCKREEDGDVLFIEIIRKDDDSHDEDLQI